MSLLGALYKATGKYVSLREATSGGKYICPDVHFQELEEAVELLKEELKGSVPTK